MDRGNHRHNTSGRVLGCLIATVALALVHQGDVSADGGVTFTDVAQEAGITYQHVPSTTFARVEELRQRSLETPAVLGDFIVAPIKPQGHPGVAIFDFDRDGDFDLYVSNGPGASNSL